MACKVSSRVKNILHTGTFAVFIHSSIVISMKGTIKRLTDKGFGFIAPEGQEKDVFFHSSALADMVFDELREGDAVSFEVEDSEKGPRAVNVTRA